MTGTNKNSNEELAAESADRTVEAKPAVDLADAINLVIADTREFDPERRITDLEILADIRALGHKEIDRWVETEMVEPGKYEDAYHTVIAATDDEIAAHRAVIRDRLNDDTDCL